MKKKRLPFIRRIENKHLQWLTGRKPRTCSRILRKARQALKKKKGQDLTIAEYACYKGLDPDEICDYLDITK